MLHMDAPSGFFSKFAILSTNSLNDYLLFILTDKLYEPFYHNNIK